MGFIGGNQSLPQGHGVREYASKQGHALGKASSKIKASYIEYDAMSPPLRIFHPHDNFWLYALFSVATRC